MNYKQTSSSEVTLTGFELHATDNLTLSSLNRIVKSAIFLILNLDLGDAVSAVITPVAAFDVLFTKLNQKPGVTLKLSFQSWVFVAKMQTQNSLCRKAVDCASLWTTVRTHQIDRSQSHPMSPSHSSLLLTIQHYLEATCQQTR